MISVLVLLLVLVLPVVAVVMIINAIIRRNNSGDDEKADFEKTTRAIYVYLILICLLCSMIGGTIYLFNSTMNYLLPEKNYDNSSYNYEEREKNEAIVGMFTASSIIISTVPLFIYHSKIAKNESLRKNK